MKRTPIGPAVVPAIEAGPRRGSDASQCSDRSRLSSLPDELRSQLRTLLAATRSKAIEDCAKIADGFAERTAFTTYALARDIAADIRALDGAAIEARGGDHLDFPWWGFV